MSPQERRARRDASAQARINPDTGLPFRNYNALDTWQRNQKARAEGFTSRATKRAYKAAETKAIRQSRLADFLFHREHVDTSIEHARQFPNSWRNFLNGREETPELAAEFNYVAQPYPKNQFDAAEKFKRKAMRYNVFGMHERDWAAWRNEYDARNR